MYCLSRGESIAQAVELHKSLNPGLPDSLLSYMDSISSSISAVLGETGFTAAVSLSLAFGGGKTSYVVRTADISPGEAVIMFGDSGLDGAYRSLSLLTGRSLVSCPVQFQTSCDGKLEVRLITRGDRSKELAEGLKRAISADVERLSGTMQALLGWNRVDIESGRRSITQPSGTVAAISDSAEPPRAYPLPGYNDASSALSGSVFDRLRASVITIGKSADAATLEFSLVSSVKWLITGSHSFCWWSVSRNMDIASLEYCDCVPAGKKSETVEISGNDLFRNALEDGGAVYSEKPSAGSHSAGGTGGMHGPTRHLLVLKEEENPSALVEFLVDPGGIIQGPELSGLEILSRQAEARLCVIQRTHRLDDERKTASMFGSYFSAKQGRTGRGTMSLCKLMLDTYGELEGAAFAVSERQGYRCVQSSFRNGIPASEDIVLSSALTRLLSPGAIVDASEVDNPPVWGQLKRSFGAYLAFSDGCSVVCSQGTRADAILLLFGENSGRRREIAKVIVPFLSAIDAVERGNTSVSEQNKAEIVTERLFSQLEELARSPSVYSIAENFSGMVHSITGAELIRFYSYDENEKALVALSPPDGQASSVGRSITAMEYNKLGSTFMNGGSFALSVDGARAGLRSSLAIDEGIGDVRIVGVNSDDRPAILLVLGFRQNSKPMFSDDQTLIRICRVMSSMLSTARTYSNTVSNTNFVMDCLQLFTHSLKSNDGDWSMDSDMTGNRLCSMTGSLLHQDFAFLFLSLKEQTHVSLLGKWSKKPFEGALLAEVTGFMKSAEGREGWPGSRSRVATMRIGGNQFPVVNDYAANFATVVSSGDSEGRISIAMLLLNSTGHALNEEPVNTLSATMDSTRLILESRYRRSNLDWALNAMRSELGVAKSQSSTFEMQSILNSTVRETGRFLGCELCFIELQDDRGGYFLASIAGNAGEPISLEQAAESTGGSKPDEHRNGFSSVMMETGGNLYIQGEKACADALSLVPEQERHTILKAMDGKPIRSVYGTPVSFAGKLLGLIVCVRSSVEKTFGKTEVGYLESVAALTSTAIENSRNMQATYEALSKLRRLDTLRSNFSSIAAHELRTPLTSIRVYIELMKMGKVGKFAENELRDIENLLASISELNEIINNMLEFTRMEAMLLETEMSTISIQPLLEEVCAQLSPAANAKSIKLELDAQKGTKKVNANAPLVKRVVNNLIGNAIKFTPEGGNIDVRLRDDTEGVLLIVEDTGKGIPSADLPYIFDRFHVVDSSILHSRTGFRLGLPISKLIVERHGGRIWADSEVGKGSRFYVLLPIKQGVSTEDWLEGATNYIH